MHRIRISKYLIIAVYFILNVTSSAFAGDNIIRLQAKPGDTIGTILTNADINEEHILKTLSELRKLYDVNNPKPGQKIRIKYEKPKKVGDELLLNSLQISLPENKCIEVLRLSGDNFEADEIFIPTLTKPFKARGKVTESMYTALQEAAVPDDVRETFTKNYSYDLDLERDVKKGDSFEIVYEKLYDQDGEFTGSGELIYSSLNVGGKDYKIYYYTMADGNADYYDEKGSTVQKSLLRTPIYSARVSSSFGEKRGTFKSIGFSKSHKGLDFAAPKGTPIYAAGSGVIEELGTKGSYGKYIKIGHDQKYDSAYAHLSKYADGLKAGSRVTQGQVIGYVGTTGNSTGPHLHYEVLRNGQQVNPLSIKTFASRRLSDKQLALFNDRKKEIYEISKRIDAQDKVARSN